jgi:hypothetical protein
MTQGRSREDTIKQDVADLHRLGYAHELIPLDGRIQQLRDQLQHHLDPHRRGDPDSVVHSWDRERYLERS